MNSEEDREFAEILALLRRAHAESVGEVQLAAVRARVLERLQPKRRWWPVWTGAAAAAALASLLFFWASQPRPVPQSVSSLHTGTRPSGSVPRPSSSAPDAPAPPRPKPKRVTRVRHARKAPPATAEPPADEPLTVKLITDDPDVVIYWIIDAKGD